MIDRPERLHIADAGGFTYGANQIWYRTRLQRRAGCGPTCAAHIIWYLAGTRPECAALTRRDGSDRAGFLGLMEDMWRYVTPGIGGVNKPAVFSGGLLRYGRERGCELSFSALEIAAKPTNRPGEAQLFDFLEAALYRDRPVAFLNLNNGGVPGLDSWHWVTLVGADRGSGGALMYDQSKRLTLDMRRWLQASTDRGALLCFDRAGG